MICPRCGSTQTTTTTNAQGCITELDCTNCDVEMHRAGPHSVWYPLGHLNLESNHAHDGSTESHTTKEYEYALPKM